MKIIKIGGAVLQSAKSFARLVDLLNLIDEPTIAVVSAIGKTSRNLENAGNEALCGDYEHSLDLAKLIINEHRLLIQNLNFDNSSLENLNGKIDLIHQQICDILEGISITNGFTKRTQDWLLSFGEDLALAIVHCFLQSNGIDIDFLDSKDFMISDDNFGNAKPDYDLSKKNLLDMISKSPAEKLLCQGFVAKSISGQITTMGFESSNLTAALVASFTDSSELVILTDVEGVYSIDPKAFKSAKKLDSISLASAKLLAHFGLKLIYPGMIALMQQHKFSISYRSLEAAHSTLLDSHTVDSDTPIFVYGKISNINLYNNNQFGLDFAAIDGASVDDFYMFIANIDFLKYISINSMLNNSRIATKFTVFSQNSSSALIIIDKDFDMMGIAEMMHNEVVA